MTKNFGFGNVVMSSAVVGVVVLTFVGAHQRMNYVAPPSTVADVVDEKSRPDLNPTNTYVIPAPVPGADVYVSATSKTFMDGYEVTHPSATTAPLSIDENGFYVPPAGLVIAPPDHDGTPLPLPNARIEGQ